ncbi:MAG: hypothetical protein KDD41_13310, partial [Flavobacteriales bacterium]|nr:hypothetical protein [Flavobacteriales bacterium]
MKALTLIKYICLLFILWLNCIDGFTQTVKVLDKETKKPIANAFVFNINKQVTATSDSIGQLDISGFAKKDTLVFTHTSYRNFMIPKINIGNAVYLEVDIQSIPVIDIIAGEDKEKALEVTSTIDKITRKEIQLQNPQTSAEMLEL